MNIPHFTARFAVSIAALTIVLLSGNAVPGQQDKPIRITTSAFRIDVNLSSQEAADQAKQVAEKTWEIGSARYGCDLPSKPLQ